MVRMNFFVQDWELPSCICEFAHNGVRSHPCNYVCISFCCAAVRCSANLRSDSMSSSSNSTPIENQEQQYGPFSRMATTMTDPRNQTKNQRQKGWGWQCYGWIPGEPRDPRVWWNQTHQRVVITTVGYTPYTFLAGYRWHPRDRKNYKRLMRTIQNVHGDGDNGDVRAENTFDILLDASHFTARVLCSPLGSLFNSTGVSNPPQLLPPTPPKQPESV